MNKPQYQTAHYSLRHAATTLLPPPDGNSQSPASTARKTLLAEEDSPAQQADSSSIIPSTSELRFYQEYKKIYTVSHHLALEKNRQNALFEDLIKRLKILEVPTALPRTRCATPRIGTTRARTTFPRRRRRNGRGELLRR